MGPSFVGLPLGALMADDANIHDSTPKQSKHRLGRSPLSLKVGSAGRLLHAYAPHLSRMCNAKQIHKHIQVGGSFTPTSGARRLKVGGRRGTGGKERGRERYREIETHERLR